MKMTEISDETDAAAAWQATVLEYEPWLRTFVASRIGDPQTVDDVVQDVLVAAIEHSADGNSIREPQAWLRTVATRQVAQHYRTTERRARREADAPVANNDELSPLEIMLRAENAGLVNMALSEMDPDAAELLRLKYIEHQSYKQIAQRLGRSWNDIAHGLHDARRTLRQRLVVLLDDEPLQGTQP